MSKESLVEEIYIIKNDEIDFLGTIIITGEETSQIYGRILLPNNKPLVFYSTKGKKEILREVLTSQCHHLAGQFQAQTVYLPLETHMTWDEFEDLFLNVTQDKGIKNYLTDNVFIN